MYTLAQNTIATANKAVLRNLCKQHGIKGYGNLNNAQMRGAINNKIMHRALFKQGMQKANAQKTQKLQPLFNPILDILSGIMPKTVQQKAPVAKRTKQRVKNDQWHPKKGGKTYAVWVQMRYNLLVLKVTLKQAKINTRNHFINTDVHPNTVNAQIYRYCKYYGLTGR